MRGSGSFLAAYVPTAAVAIAIYAVASNAALSSGARAA